MLVSNGTCWSDEFIMNFGVRQGSVLSPFMFAVYIDSIANVSNLSSNLFIVLYADYHFGCAVCRAAAKFI